MIVLALEVTALAAISIFVLRKCAGRAHTSAEIAVQVRASGPLIVALLVGFEPVKHENDVS
jgi:hypothetical protein